MVNKPVVDTLLRVKRRHALACHKVAADRLGEAVFTLLGAGTEACTAN
jgi:hypothetical protein